MTMVAAPPLSTFPAERTEVRPTSRADRLTIIVPAYNEAASIRDTVESLLGQTTRPAEVIVIDDCSTDDTAAIAREAGATVIQPPQNTGSKAGAQNFALTQVTTEYVMAIDADTVLAPDAVELIMAAFDEPGVAVACGFVLPRHVETIWERGRYVEYLFAFTYFKRIQDWHDKALIASGCFSVYRSDVLMPLGGWPTRTMAEDMDLTWTLHEQGRGVRFVPEALSYPIEPHDYNFMSKQLRRWSHGFVQNVRQHWRGIVEVSYLRSAVAVGLWDASVASILFLVAMPLLALFVSPWFLLGYLIDLPVVAVPVLAAAIPRGETMKALASLPSFAVLRLVNSLFFLKALWSELVLGRSLTVYEKGH